MTTIKTIRRVIFGPTVAEISKKTEAARGPDALKFYPPLPELLAPEPVPASVQLRRNLERASATYTNRENILLQEIEARQAELADVRRAKGAVDTALIDLHVGDELATDEVEDVTEQEAKEMLEKAAWPFGQRVAYSDDALADLKVRPVPPSGFSTEQIEMAQGSGLDLVGHYYSIYRATAEPEATFRRRILQVRADG